VVYTKSCREILILANIGPAYTCFERNSNWTCQFSQQRLL